MQTEGSPTIYRVLHQAQDWRETLSSGGKHCPLRGVGVSWKDPKNDPKCVPSHAA